MPSTPRKSLLHAKFSNMRTAYSLTTDADEWRMIPPSCMISISGLSNSSIATFIADVITVMRMLPMQLAKACTVVPEAIINASCGASSSTAFRPMRCLASG